jgi:actin-related protein
MAERTIVLDNGSGTIHAGFAEDDNPILSFPNYSETGLGFGSNVNFVDLSTSESYKSYVMSSNNGNLKMTWPIEHGIIKNWESMESVWDYTFSTALRIQPDEYNILITEAIMNPKANREKMAQILFEKYNFQAIHVPHSAMLPLYSSGLTTGLVLDCGDGVIQAVPVWGGE